MANPGDTPDKITYFAETDYRSKRIKFGIRDDDRGRHMYIIGKTGMGKSTLLENLAIQDIQNGEGVCFIDPHGGTAETLLSYVPEHRINDVIYFAPFDTDYPVAINVLEDIGKDKRALVASGLMGAFKKVWVDAWSARMEYLLNNALLALLEYPGSTLLGVNRIFADKNYRNMIVNNVTDPSVKAFWVDEFAKYSDKFATEATAAIQNKVGQFAANPLIRNMVGQPKSTFDIRKVMDERKILIVNLSKGRMGEGNANLVGSMLITKIYLAAMSRADVGAEVVRSLPPFYLYVDEFQSFANESFADILSEARKYKLSLTIAHQYIEQMSDEVRAAVFGNVGTMISFRVGSYDAEVLEKEYAPAFTAEDLVNLGFAQIYLKLMIRGVGSPPFSATTLARPKLPVNNFGNAVVAASRQQFARPRAEVEADIRSWHEPIPEPPRDPNAPFVPETRKYPPGSRPQRPLGASAPYAAPALRERPGVQETSRPVRDDRFTQMPPAAIPPPPVNTPTIPRAPYAPPADRSTSAPLPPQAPPPASGIAAPIEIDPEGENYTPEEAYQGGVPSSVLPATHRPFADQFAQLEQPELPGGAKNTQRDDVHRGRRVAPHPNESRVHTERVVLAPLYTGAERRVGTPSHGSALPYGERRGSRSPLAPRPSGVPPEHGGNTPPHSSGVSLASLKTNVKKDKGPSMGNLSSLRDALNAVTKNSGGEEKKESAAPVAARQEVPPRAPDASAPYATAPRVSTLLDVPTSPPAKEVPEDVLRSILAD